MPDIEKMLECKKQTKQMRFPLDIQLFADDPQDPPTPPTDPQDSLADSPKDPEPKPLTQEDIDNAVKKAKEEWEAAQQAQQTDCLLYTSRCV